MWVRFSIFGLVAAAASFASPEPALSLAGIAHVAFRVSDLSAARAFYEKLGFETAFEFSKDGAVTESFIKINDRQFIELYPRKDSSQPLGVMHICYESAELQGLHDEYVKRGLNPSPVKKAGAGNLLFVLHDSEGQLIEFTQYMPESKHSQDRGQHLGSQRVSDVLLGASIPVDNTADEQAFYTEKLGFTQSKQEECSRLLLPGDSGQQLGFGCRYSLLFKSGATRASTADPDGNKLAFRDYFAGWPPGISPQEIGKLVAEHFVTSPHMGTKHINYPEVCAWYGALTFARLAEDKDLTERLIRRFDPLITGEESALIPHAHHVDSSIFGAVPLEIFIETKDPKYLDLGKQKADEEWEKPTPDGLSDESRFWIDDMYMITIVQLQAYRATGDSKYLDRAALEMTAYLEKLQEPNGLFYHAPDAPFYWLRGNGWVAAGMTELLSSLAGDHPKRARILEAYRKMMHAALEFQSADGSWRQLIDRPEAWPESSGTGMLTFAMISGVKNGWLDESTYGSAARKGWIALTGFVDQNANVTQVCEGTNKKTEIEYYLQRKRKTGDFHGQAPVLWCASALLR